MEYQMTFIVSLEWIEQETFKRTGREGKKKWFKTVYKEIVNRELKSEKGAMESGKDSTTRNNSLTINCAFPMTTSDVKGGIHMNLGNSPQLILSLYIHPLQCYAPLHSRSNLSFLWSRPLFGQFIARSLSTLQCPQNWPSERPINFEIIPGILSDKWMWFEAGADNNNIMSWLGEFERDWGLRRLLWLRGMEEAEAPILLNPITYEMMMISIASAGQQTKVHPLNHPQRQRCVFLSRCPSSPPQGIVICIRWTNPICGQQDNSIKRGLAKKATVLIGLSADRTDGEWMDRLVMLTGGVMGGAW